MPDVPISRVRVAEAGTPSQQVRIDVNGYVKLSEDDVHRIASAVVEMLTPTPVIPEESAPPVAEGQEELFATKRNTPDYRQGYVTRTK